MTRASLSGVERLDVSGLTHTQLGLDEHVEGGSDRGWGAAVSARGMRVTGRVCSGFRTAGTVPVHPREGAEGLTLSRDKWECCPGNICLGDIPQTVSCDSWGKEGPLRCCGDPGRRQVGGTVATPLSLLGYLFCQLSASPQAGQQPGGLLCYVVFLHSFLVPWPVDPSSDGDLSPGLSDGKLQMTHGKSKEGLFLNSDSQRCQDIYPSAPEGRNMG